MEIKQARFTRIVLQNFRNIEYGDISFPNSGGNDLITENASLLGIYGQNGSGKTSLLSAIRIFHDLVLGETIIFEEECINKNADEAKIDYYVQIKDEQDNIYNISYSIILIENKLSKKDIQEYSSGSFLVRKRAKGKKREELKATIVKTERVEFGGVAEDGVRIKQKVLFSTEKDFCFGERAFGSRRNSKVDSLYELMIKNNKQYLVNESMDVHFKQLRERTNKRGFSFFFCQEFFDCFYVVFTGQNLNNVILPTNILSYLKQIALNIFIVSIQRTADIYQNTIPLFYRKK